MKNQALLASLLVVPSILNIAASSSVIGYYNGPPATTRDAKYWMAVVYLCLGIVGVLLGLTAMVMYGDSDLTVWMIGAGLVWSAVTAAATANAQVVIGQLAATFVINWIIYGLVVLLQVVAYFFPLLDNIGN